MTSIKDYQRFTKTTAIYPFSNSSLVQEALYLGLGLSGESGEVAELIKKQWRDNIYLDKDKFKKELGDVLWYISQLCNWAELDLQEVIDHNIEKLTSRKGRGVLQGSGDNR